MNTWAPRGIVTPKEWHEERVLRPVVGVDIDGTLCHWHRAFLDFAEDYLQKNVRRDWDGTEPFWTMLGVSKPRYREIKLRFRQSGLKRAIAPLPGAQQFLTTVRATGAEIWVCTTRPYLRLDNIDPDTRWWLRHHGMRYDGVLFGERKYRDLYRLFGPRVVGVIDDLPEQVEAAITVGIPAYVLDRAYNGTARGLPRLASLFRAEEHFTHVITQWKKERNVRG